VPLEEEKLELKAQALLFVFKNFGTLAIFGVSWKLYT
jgi:hypothetical protein